MKSSFRQFCRVRSPRGFFQMFAVVALLPCTVWNLAAQEKKVDSTTVTNRLPDVVVTAGRLPATTVPVEKFPANVTVLNSSDIAASPAFTLPELLRQQAGFTP